VDEVLSGEEGVDQIGLDTVERPIVYDVGELFFFVLVGLGCVYVFLAEVPALEPGLGVCVRINSIY